MGAASAPIHAFMEFLLTNTPYDIPTKPLAAFLHNNCGNSGERGMNPVAMTIISLREKNSGRAKDGTSDLLFSSSVRCRLSYGARPFYECT